MQTKINTMIIATFGCHCNTNSIIQRHKRLDMVLGRVEQTALCQFYHKTRRINLINFFKVVFVHNSTSFPSCRSCLLYLPLSCVGTGFLFLSSAFISFLIGSLPHQVQSQSQLLLFPHSVYFGRKRTHKSVLLLQHKYGIMT